MLFWIFSWKNSATRATKPKELQQKIQYSANIFCNIFCNTFFATFFAIQISYSANIFSNISPGKWIPVLFLYLLRWHFEGIEFCVWLAFRSPQCLMKKKYVFWYITCSVSKILKRLTEAVQMVSNLLQNSFRKWPTKMDAGVRIQLYPATIGPPIIGFFKIFQMM